MSSTIKSNRYQGDSIIYDVVYSINKNRLCISPPHREETLGCILFFGGSLTFGEGVNDNETLRYQTGLKTDQQYQIYNFGLHGYGPHQMLSALENGLVDTIINCKPEFAIYLTFSYHIERSAGKTYWDVHGPKYILSEDGRVHYEGSFDGDYIVTPAKIITQLSKSLVINKVKQKYFGNEQKNINDDDINLFIAILKNAKEDFETRYQGSEFHIVFWDGYANERNARVVKKLKRKGLKVHLITQIIPDINNETKYLLGKEIITRIL
jgi:hypothetical protein